jgi:hypothetical protein
MGDKFLNMMEQQERFMRLLQEKRGFPAFPVDLSETLLERSERSCEELSHLDYTSS